MSGQEGHSVPWGMAQAGVASLRALPRTGHRECAASPSHSDRMELLNPSPGRGCGAGLWGRHTVGKCWQKMLFQQFK